VITAAVVASITLAASSIKLANDKYADACASPPTDSGELLGKRVAFSLPSGYMKPGSVVEAMLSSSEDSGEARFLPPEVHVALDRCP